MLFSTFSAHPPPFRIPETFTLEDMPLIETKKKWMKNVANMGSIPGAQCYKDNMQDICLCLTTAFAPSHDEDTIPFGSYEELNGSTHAEPPKAKQRIHSQARDPGSPRVDWTPEPHSTSTSPAKDEHTVFEQTTDEVDTEMMGTDIQKTSSLCSAERVTETQDPEMQDADERPDSDSDSDKSHEKTDEASSTIIESTNDYEKLSDAVSVAEPPDQATTATGKPSSSPNIKVINRPFHSTTPKLAFTETRALYLRLLYHDRFVLLSSSSFLLFLSQQPSLSHIFLRYLIDHGFGFRYVHRDGSNANHGVTPFWFPFPPVSRDLPLGLYFENRWTLLNDPSWLEWVNTEEFIMAAFWAEMSFRGGLGGMQRRKEVTERASRFKMSPF